MNFQKYCSRASVVLAIVFMAMAIFDGTLPNYGKEISLAMLFMVVAAFTWGD